MRELAKAKVREVLKTESDPLSVLTEIAADPAVELPLRIQAATAACPFLFPRLSAAVIATAPASAPADTTNLVERLMRRFERLAPPVQTIEGEAA